MRFLKSAFFFLFFSFVAKALSAQRQYHLLIGTYATQDKPNGIHVYRFDVDSGTFEREHPVTELANASYLAISRDGKNVYALGEAEAGGVNAFTFDASSGALKYMNSVRAAGPAYVSVDDKKEMVFAANYGGGSVLTVRLNKDGSFATADTRVMKHTGSSVVKERQEKPHVHSVVLSPDNKYLFAPDLGTDRVYQYRIDAKDKDMITPLKMPFLAVMPGGGPRHITFSADGKFAYLVLELAGAIMALSHHDGRLKELQTFSMVTPDFKGQVSGADIHLSPDGRFLYASNRGDADEIAIFSVNQLGKISLIGRQSVLGKTPRNFAIDPTGNFLLVANQNSNDIVIFKINKTTGLLTPTGKKIEIDKPVCLKFIAVR